MKIILHAKYEILVSMFDSLTLFYVTNQTLIQAAILISIIIINPVPYYRVKAFK